MNRLQVSALLTLPKQRRVPRRVLVHVQLDPADAQLPQQLGGGIDGAEGTKTTPLQDDPVVDLFNGAGKDMEGTVAVLDDEGTQDRPGVDQGGQLGLGNGFGFAGHIGFPKTDIGQPYH